MEVAVQGGARPTPFLQARDLFETELDLDLPVRVYVRPDPDERTWASHPGGHHVLNISDAAARSAMARELTLHEFAHMYRYEQEHVSHRHPTEEAIYLTLAGRSTTPATITHCYQIANHVKDIYADDLTLQFVPGRKLVTFLESQLARAVAENGITDSVAGGVRQPAIDPELAAVNAAFAAGLVDRHDLVDANHDLYTFADILAYDAPTIPFQRLRGLFGGLPEDPTVSQFRRSLTEAIRTYVDATDTGGERKSS